ncbi:2-dehydro-3-deoxy-D-gluconate 5-dehydrogenase KduD [Clostridium perfringens]|uniref:2-dehydro-3-deoxy-D-gluconate 5-dehydrogenase KduD n=11 Tax=Clostridium perfringens TaxID=1502 RepID=A0AAN3R175_CLOPF|nr:MULTISPECIES: 2-dehydro-3-deoxy-D-gluconate 5-dehydrogenase KduD [Clostridium]EHK2328142.1 2-dehydro-3-deoxy-D-gluconate 5-dehydrogenase KduD [Clostridium perfringens]EHK2442013.1 2-dehydro-3-deoxy-D-gluconate 5-dehydrogenase KduD [Clostridium perfringens]EHR0217497.1 2-dehydro-3-deoxy-D-gluconate 5-dehydrogenase KduD [Clostridium perfringens]EIF2087190.1 2-dehydro-3-deoxy-D-gluconate 5-dehydrogenase KduD [Clostridium perfringens]EIF6174217.1 2-dehydro-3-deoxy-D-gluconate 5-dehydrogenase Kd
MKMNMEKFSLDFFKLDGKVAIVTGGNTGLGMAYVEALAAAGADVLVTTFDNNTEEVKNIVESLGRKIVFVQGDLTKKETRDKVVSTCLEEFGKIDILVNNAGTIRRAPLLEYKDEDWQAVMDINLNSVYYLSQAVAKVMAKQGYGKIINIASMLSFQGGKFVPPYTASKHGVAGITKAFANELADLNIQVNAIAPGYIKTANTAPIRADKARNQEILSRIPAGRWGEVSDLMGTVVFLSSKASDYLNGHILAIDGGWLVR